MAEDNGQDALEDVLDDLCCRFILNLPSSEFESFERLFFAIESAYWYYLDFWLEENPSLPKFSLRDFAVALFEHTPLLQPFRAQVDEHVAAFKTYKQKVPKCGAAMLNSTMDRVLLVLGWGPRGRWSFPKGKLGNDETEYECAVREVEEETGFNFAEFGRSTDYLDLVQQDVRTRIFVVQNISESTEFEPKTRKEIARIEWHHIDDLPDRFAHENSNKFYSVVPFVARLKKWIRTRQNKKTGAVSVPEGGDQRRSAQRKSAARDRSEPRSASARKGQPKGRGGRDRLTFGTPDGGLNDHDREALFTKYMEEAEQRRQELDTAEYDHIVDSITYGNQGAAQIARRLQLEEEATLVTGADPAYHRLDGHEVQSRDHPTQGLPRLPDNDGADGPGDNTAMAPAAQILGLGEGDFSFNVQPILQCFS